MSDLASSGWEGVGLETRVRRLLSRSWQERVKDCHVNIYWWSVLPGLCETPSREEETTKMNGT